MNELLSHYNTTYLQAGTISTLFILLYIWAHWPKKQKPKDVIKVVQRSQKTFEDFKYINRKLRDTREANR